MYSGVRAQEARRICHIAAVDHRSNRIAAALTRAGWLLPTIAFSVETSQESILMQASAALSTAVIPRCLAFPRVDRTASSRDTLLIADVSPRISAVANDSFHMVDREILNRTAALVPYQRSALHLLASRGHPDGLALKPLWLRDVIAWLSDLGLTDSSIAPLLETRLYRATEQRVVAAMTACGRTFHFKAETARPFVEAELTQLMSAVRPDLVAPTLAFDRNRGWWLTLHVDGAPLDAPHWPTHLEALAAWVSLQRSLRDHQGALQSIGVVRLDRERLLAATRDAVSADSEDTSPHTRARPPLDRVHRLLDARMYRDTSEGLLHFDAASRNILLTDRGCIFLDLESAYLGPSIICGELFMRRMKRELPAVQRTELSRAGAAAVGCDPTAQREPLLLGRISALTDLCLLAYHHHALSNRLHASFDEDTPRHAWRRLSRDFLLRVHHWFV
jgi:hypothetical protein